MAEQASAARAMIVRSLAGIAVSTALYRVIRSIVVQVSREHGIKLGESSGNKKQSSGSRKSKNGGGKSPKTADTKTQGPRETILRAFGTKLQTSLSTYADTPTALAGPSVVGVYVSASWCAPCRAFTPKLKRMYAEAREAISGSEKGLEIVFVSLDKNEDEFKRSVFGQGFSTLFHACAQQAPTPQHTHSRTRTSACRYFGKMPWSAVPYLRNSRRKKSAKLVPGQGIPKLCFFDNGTGRLLVGAGRQLVQGLSTGAELMQALKKLKSAV